MLGKAGASNLKRNVKEMQDAANAFAANLAGVIQGFKAAKLSQRAMVDQLNQLGIPASRAGRWSRNQLQRLITANIVAIKLSVFSSHL